MRPGLVTNIQYNGFRERIILSWNPSFFEKFVNRNIIRQINFYEDRKGLFRLNPIRIITYTIAMC